MAEVSRLNIEPKSIREPTVTSVVNSLGEGKALFEGLIEPSKEDVEDKADIEEPAIIEEEKGEIEKITEISITKSDKKGLSATGSLY